MELTAFLTIKFRYGKLISHQGMYHYFTHIFYCLLTIIGTTDYLCSISSRDMQVAKMYAEEPGTPASLIYLQAASTWTMIWNSKSLCKMQYASMLICGAV